MKNPIEEKETTFHVLVDNSGLPRKKTKVRTTKAKIAEACNLLDRHLSDVYATMPGFSYATMYRMSAFGMQTCEKLFAHSFDYLWTLDYDIVLNKNDGSYAGVILAEESKDRILLLDHE